MRALQPLHTTFYVRSIGTATASAPLRPLSLPRRRVFVLRRASVSARASDGASDDDDVANINQAAGVADAPPQSRPTRVLGAALAALMMVRACSAPSRDSSRAARVYRATHTTTSTRYPDAPL